MSVSESLITTARLAGLAEQITREHTQACEAARSALEHARVAGELLLEAKTKVAHGEWLPWLGANFEFSERTAQGYMRLSRQWPELEAKAQRVADLSVREALHLLAEPSVVDGRDEVVTLLQGGSAAIREAGARMVAEELQSRMVAEQERARVGALVMEATTILRDVLNSLETEGVSDASAAGLAEIRKKAEEAETCAREITSADATEAAALAVAIARWTANERVIDRNLLLRGAIVSSAVGKFGEESIEKLASETNSNANELRQYRQVYEFRRQLETERVVERGLGTFSEVESALAEIREARLYRADFATFENYCQKRWEMKPEEVQRFFEFSPKV